MYVNVEQNVATLAPVFKLNQTQMIVRDILGYQIDFNLLDKQIAKIKNQINLQTCKLPLVGEATSDEKEQMWLEQRNAEHVRIQREVEQSIKKEDLYVPTDGAGYSSVAGANPDECSLLSQIAGQFFQYIPEYLDE